MLTVSQATRKLAKAAPRARRLAPVIEAVERRQMLDAAGGFLAGTVFTDSNANGVIDINDAYLPGARVELSRPGQGGVVASTTTDANGSYAFQGLAPGTYLLTETPPIGNQATDARALSQVNPAARLSASTIQVTVGDPNLLYVKNDGIPASMSFRTNNLVNGQVVPNTDGPLRLELGTTVGGNDVNAGFLSLCLDDLTPLSFSGGETFRVIPTTLGNLTHGNGTDPVSAENLGRIAFLFNHFGNDSLTNVQGPALQLAIWELIYDPSNNLNLSTGNFQVTGPFDPTQQAQLDQILQQANAYLNLSQGKSENAILLDASTPAATDHPAFYQSVIATGSYDFLNSPQLPQALASIAGYVFVDSNGDCVKQPNETPIPGTVITLTGSDNQGLPVSKSTTTDANGHYVFDNLQPGVYSVHEVQPAGYLDGGEMQGTPGNGVVSNDLFTGVRLDAGVHGENNNFCELLPVAPQELNTVEVSSLTLNGIHHQQSSVVLTLQGPADASQVLNPANYRLTALGRDQTLGTADDRRIRIRSVSYDQGTGKATLVLARHLDIHYHYLLEVSLPGNSTTQPLRYTEVFGRASMSVWNYHGRNIPAPRLTAREALLNQRIIDRAQRVLQSQGRAQAGTGAHATASHISAQTRQVPNAMVHAANRPIARRTRLK